MRKIKKLVALAMITTMAFSMAGCKLISKTPEAIANETVAKVGDYKITKGEVDKEIKPQIDGLKKQYGEDYENKIDAQLKEQLKQIRMQYLDRLVNEKILLTKAKELKIEISKEDIDKEVENRIKSLIESYGSEEKLEEAKKSFGYTDETFNEFLSEQIKIEKIIDEITKEITVSDEDVSKEYETNKDKYVEYGEADVKHLLFNTEEEAKAASDKINSGEVTFDQLFEEYKDNKAKKTAEGASEEDKKLPISEDLEKVSHGEQNFDPLFLDGLKPLKEGEVSAPVKSSFGFHIIQAKNVKATVQKELNDELKGQIKTTLEQTKKNEDLQAKLEGWKKDLKVKIYEDKL